jgi:iron-sulfur cluster assembly protein
VITRRAMMSALRSPATQSPPPQTMSDSPSSPSTSRNTVPLDSKTMISRDAAAPQTAARPPAAPKVEKPRPQLRATKAAMTMVCIMVSLQLFRGCSADLRKPSNHYRARLLM